MAAKCNLCERNSIEGIKIKDGFLCNQCLSKCYKVPVDRLFTKHQETKQFANMNFEEIVNSVSCIADYVEQMEKEKNDEIIKQERMKALAEEMKVLEEERKKAFAEAEKRKSGIVVTTMDINRDYEIIRPVYIQINNRSDTFRILKSKYEEMVYDIKNNGQGSNDNVSRSEIMQVLFLNAGAYNGHADFDTAFFIAVQELKQRAALLGADAVIGMRQDIDLDSNGFQYFYLQMYGTAVKFK